MTVAKGFLQATVVVMWAVYALVQLVTNRGGTTEATTDPTGGMALLTGFLETLPIEPLVLPTVVMAAGLIGLEVVFAVIRRA